MLCDKILNTAFQPNNKNGSHEPAIGRDSEIEAVEVQETSVEKPQARSEPMPHRPSQIMRRMDRLAQERWLKKIHPAKAAEEERDQILR